MKVVANPIWRRELKERVRSRRTVVGFSVYLAILGLVLWLAERGQERTTFGQLTSASAGRTVFHILVMVLLFLVCFLLPAYAAGSISSERERQTFQLVQVTLMRPYQIVLGKLGAALSWLLLLVVATLPFVAVGFVLGGVTLGQVLGAYAMVVFTGFTLALLGMAVSARARRTMTAALIAQTIVLMLLFGTPILYAALRAPDRYQGRPSQMSPILGLNPFVGMAAAIGEPGHQPAAPFDSMADGLRRETTQLSQYGYQGSDMSDLLVLYLSFFSAVGVFAFRSTVAAVRAPALRLRLATPRRRRAVQETP